MVTSLSLVMMAGHWSWGGSSVYRVACLLVVTSPVVRSSWRRSSHSWAVLAGCMFWRCETMISSALCLLQEVRERRAEASMRGKQSLDIDILISVASRGTR